MSKKRIKKLQEKLLKTSETLCTVTNLWLLNLNSVTIAASKGKLFQPTPRKALFDVNQELSNVTTLRTHGKSEFGSAGSKGGLLSSQKASVKISNGVENIPVGGHGKVQDSKKTSVIKVGMHF